MEKRYIDYQEINLKPFLLSVDLPEENIRVGNALFLVSGKKAILWHIFVKKEYRKKGFASNLIVGAKQIFDEIVTDWETQEGHDLCIKNGFKSRKTDELRLVWKKGEDNNKKD